jgi:hypothetical protein
LQVVAFFNLKTKTMALIPVFTVAQNLGTPSKVTLTDTSTGSDGTITSRRVYVQMWDGTYLVGAGVITEYNTWSYAQSTVLLDILSKSTAVKITVQWLNASDVVVVDKIGYYGLTEYSEEFDYGLTQNVASNQRLMNNNNFWYNKSKLRTLIDSGNKAILNYSDIYSAQQCYDQATDLDTDSTYYFNINS